jgi:hypothetical protein
MSLHRGGIFRAVHHKGPEGRRGRQTASLAALRTSRSSGRNEKTAVLLRCEGSDKDEGK